MQVNSQATFWTHLDELRRVLWRIAVVLLVVMVVAFSFKTLLFDILLAPHRSDFITYKLFSALGETIHVSALRLPDFKVDLINVNLTAPFLLHISSAFYMALLITFPFIILTLFRFIAPALRSNERRYSARVIFFSCVCFYAGVLLNYFLIFPLSFRFLATYEVSTSVVNTITLSSYMSTLTMLSLLMGAVFEMPVIAWFLAKTGMLKAEFLRKHRKKAIVVLLIVAAIITPTSDIFTLLLVFAPVYMLYEVSIFIMHKSARDGKPHCP